MRRIYYYAPLHLTFRSSMTHQQLKNFCYLGQLDYHTWFFGTYSDDAAMREIDAFVRGKHVSILQRKGTRKLRFLMEGMFLWRIAQDRSPDKIVIARQLDTMRRLQRLRCNLGHPTLILELHERAFPHLLTSNQQVGVRLKRETERVFDGVDGLTLNNYSQELVLKQEFPSAPPYAIVTQAVEYKKFHAATPFISHDGKDARVITYMGHFSTWRDIELLFQALACLGSGYRLRIAGGITSGYSDDSSAHYLADLADRYGVSHRVEYLGHVASEQLVERVLSGSAVLVLPLGDNLMGRFFTAPIKLFEYMSTRIPVVAVDFPSVNLITGRDTVFLTAHDAGLFARTIEEALTSDERELRIERMNALAQANSFEERARKMDEWLRRAGHQTRVTRRHSLTCRVRLA